MYLHEGTRGGAVPSRSVAAVDRLAIRKTIDGRSGCGCFQSVSILFPFRFLLSLSGSCGWGNVSNVSTFSEQFGLVDRNGGSGRGPFSFKTLLKIWKHWKHFISPEGSW